MAFLDEETGVLVAPGPPGASAYETWLGLGNVGSPEDFIASQKGEKGDRSTEPGPPGEQGPPGSGTVTTARRSTMILPSTCVVQQIDGRLAVADPTNLAHQGLYVGVDVEGGAAGTLAQVCGLGEIVGVSGVFSAGDAVWIGDGTTGRLGSLVATPPSSSTTADIWRQQVGTASGASTINGLLGLAYRVRASAVPALVGAGSYINVSEVGRAIVTATDAPKAPTASITETAAATDATGRIVTAPYLLGLRNKTINVRRYASVNSAAADMADGFTLDVPAGNFQASGMAGLSIANASIAVRGEGAGVSRFYFPAGSQGLTLTQDSYYRTMLVKGLSLHTQGANTGTALKIVRPAGLSGIQSGPRIIDVETLGDDPGVHGWSVGYDLLHCWNALIDRWQFQGIDGQTSATPLILRGQSTAVCMRAANIVWADRAVWSPAGSFTEGFVAEVPQIVACNEGFVFEDPSNPNQPGGNAPLIEIRGGHTATYKFGLRAVNRNSVKVSGHTLYKRPDSTANWVAVQLSGAANSSNVMGCNIYGYKGTSAGGTATAFVSQGSIGNAFQGNVVHDCDVGVAPVDQAVVVKNNLAHNVTTWASNTPTGSVIEAPFTF